MERIRDNAEERDRANQVARKISGGVEVRIR